MLYFQEDNKVRGYRVEATDKKGVEDVLKEELNFVRFNAPDEVIKPNNEGRILIGNLESDAPFTVATAAPFVGSDARNSLDDMQRLYLEGIENGLGASYREQLVNLLHQEEFRIRLVSVLRNLNNASSVESVLTNANNPDIEAFRKLLPFIRLVLEKEYDIFLETERVRNRNLKRKGLKPLFADGLPKSATKVRMNLPAFPNAFNSSRIDDQMYALNSEINVARTNSAVEKVMKLDFKKTR